MLAIRPLMSADAGQVLSLNVSARPNVAPLDGIELARLQALSQRAALLGGADPQMLVHSGLSRRSGADHDKPRRARRWQRLAAIDRGISGARQARNVARELQPMWHELR